MSIGTLLAMTVAALVAEPGGHALVLFAGHDVERWVAAGETPACENGCLTLSEAAGWLRTHHRYRDFTLDWQWRADKDSPSPAAVLFRAELPGEGAGRPQGPEISLRAGEEGTLRGAVAASPSADVVRAEWNQARLTVRGRTAQLELNGTQVWAADGVQDQPGWIVLAGGPGTVWKDIRVEEIGYRSLFNGRDLEGWEGAGSDAADCWAVQDQTLLCTGRKGPWLRSREQFGDFNLRLEYKLKAGGNSGAYIRVPSSGSHHGEGAGIEVQILDDAAERYRNLKPYQFTGSLYAIAAAEPRVARPAGRWNTLEIDARGRTYRVVHNGSEVIAADEQQYPELTQRLVNGFLGLQNHHEEVWFRHLRIGPSLQSEEQAAAPADPAGGN
jgi:hypothetical protein